MDVQFTMEGDKGDCGVGVRIRLVGHTITVSIDEARELLADLELLICAVDDHGIPCSPPQPQHPWRPMHMEEVEDS